MMGHKICFDGEIWLIVPKSSLLPFLSGALITQSEPSDPNGPENTICLRMLKLYGGDV